jgi:hypothetical protein
LLPLLSLSLWKNCTACYLWDGHKRQIAQSLHPTRFSCRVPNQIASSHIKKKHTQLTLSLTTPTFPGARSIKTSRHGASTTLSTIRGCTVFAPGALGWFVHPAVTVTVTELGPALDSASLPAVSKGQRPTTGCLPAKTNHEG